MKIKIFNSSTSTDDLENQIAEWTKDLNPDIISTNMSTDSLVDFYDDGKMCNKWIEYSLVIIYK